MPRPRSASAPSRPRRAASQRQGRLTLIVFALGALLLDRGRPALRRRALGLSSSPGGRFALVLALIAVLHAGGAVAARSSPALVRDLARGRHGGASAPASTSSGQIFHMAEHWPAALLLWSVGAAVGVYLLRQWPQVLWLAVLAPAWLWGEWIDGAAADAVWRGLTPATVGIFLLACAYLMAQARGFDGALAARARLARRDCADSGRHRARDGERRGLGDRSASSTRR